jgi:hypothetical protein
MPIHWDDDDGGGDIYADLPWAQHSAETGKFVVNMRTRRPDASVEIAPEKELIIDFGSLHIGYCQYNPTGRRKYTFWLNPAHLGYPERPAVPNLRDALKCQVMIEDIGAACLTLRGSFNCNAMNVYIAQYRRAPQGIDGQLPTWKLKPSILEEWEGEDYFPIVLEQQKRWYDRDPNIYGERYVPPPRGRRGATVVGYTPALLLPDTTAAPTVPVATLQATPAAVASEVVPPSEPAPAEPVAPYEVPAAAAPAAPEPTPFDGPYTTPPATAATPAREDPFAIFRRGDQPTPRPIPKPSKG